jgi:hypothetical protein
VSIWKVNGEERDGVLGERKCKKYSKKQMIVSDINHVVQHGTTNGVDFVTYCKIEIRDDL